MELEGNNEGVECLRLLNEIIADFDEVTLCLCVCTVYVVRMPFVCPTHVYVGIMKFDLTEIT